MEKGYSYVLVYMLEGKKVAVTSSNNYAVISRKKKWYDEWYRKAGHTGEGKIEKLIRGR